MLVRSRASYLGQTCSVSVPLSNVCGLNVAVVLRDLLGKLAQKAVCRSGFRLAASLPLFERQGQAGADLEEGRMASAL